MTLRLEYPRKKKAIKTFTVDPDLYERCKMLINELYPSVSFSSFVNQYLKDLNLQLTDKMEIREKFNIRCI